MIGQLICEQDSSVRDKQWNRLLLASLIRNLKGCAGRSRGQEA